MSSSTKGTPRHDVFIGSSCDGTRNSFVSHLSAALKRVNITVTEEDDKNQSPESRPYLPKKTRLAIERSKICVVIFSENFAFSKHSLSTLVEVIEWRHSKTGATVIPVFYGSVDRSMVEQQIGKFGEALAKHEESEPKDRVTEWRNALKGATHINEGLQSDEESSDLKLVEDIVSYVHEKLFPTDEIGINSRVLGIENLLSKQSWVVRSVGIWGMAGIGKTTIARAAFNQMKGNYKSPRFIPNFEKEFEKEGMYGLRRRHLPSKVKEKLDINITITEDSSREESVFLVLDDVRNPINAEAFLGGFEWFDPGSVIIITSRDKHVLVQCGMVEIYEVKGLDNEESLKLFSQFAFGKSKPEEFHSKVSDMVVEYANGNAKVLSYYGNALKDKKPEEMEIAFLQLKLNPPAEILKVFKSSYDELSDDDKNIYLDIACFFRGDIIDRVMQVLDGCGFFPCIGIYYLVEKSLVTICGNRVEMHNLIQDVGKEIQNQEVIAGKGRRLFCVKSIQPLLQIQATKQNVEENGLEDIESILLEASSLSFVVDPAAFQDMCNLRLLKIYSSDHEKRPGIDLCKGIESFPYELRLLHWENYSLRTLPEEFDPDNLVELNMPHSHLQELWEEPKNLKSLKRISLHHSKKLVDIKELKDTQNLELIDLRGCTSLQSFPPTKHLHHLQVLNLSGCTGIRIFPEVPENIKELCLKGTSISEIPASIETLSRLVKLELGDCKELLNFLVKFYNMESLELLNLSGCTSLKSFPEIPKRVKTLQYLYLSGTAIEELHTSLSNMVGLKVLEVSRNLKRPFSLKDLKDLKILEK